MLLLHAGLGLVADVLHDSINDEADCGQDADDEEEDDEGHDAVCSCHDGGALLFSIIGLPDETWRLRRYCFFFFEG
jgi:hypothetical protein